MKKVLITLSLIMLTVAAFGQIQHKFNYQAVIRNTDGTAKANSIVSMDFRILDMAAGETPVFVESHSPTTNEFGMVTLVIGDINEMNLSWTEGPFNLEVTVDGNLMGSNQILAVPFALAVADKNDADADPANELQDLQFIDNVLTITGNPDATPISISGGGSSQWVLRGDTLSISDQKVGIGTTSPGGKLVVKGDITQTNEEPLFEVQKADGQTVFAVYNDGTEIYVNENPTKGKKGGFAVGGYNASGKATTTNFMFLTPENYFIGHSSGIKITTGLYNSTLGYQAGMELTSGSENIFLGYQAGFNNTDGNQNTFLGYEAGYSNTSGFQNSFIGYRAGNANTTGQNNLFLGYEAGYSNTTGNFNMFMGYRAGAVNTAGTANIFLGQHAGRTNTTGSNNLFIGNGAGHNNVDGARNLFIGSMAGNLNVTGSSNLFFGESAGASNTVGVNNVFIGTAAGGGNTSGNRNIFIGDQAGLNNSSGYENSILGYQSGNSLINGTNNVFMGFESGYRSNGSENVYIGSRTGKTNRGSNNIFIGTGAGGLEDSISNTLIIDNRIGVAAEDAMIYGNFDGIQTLKFTARVGIWRTPTGNRLEVEGSASKSTPGEWVANSDMRIKTEIQDLKDAYDIMLKLHPVKYKYTEEYKTAHPGIKDQFYYNFLAQEFQEVFPEAVQSSGEILESAQDEILQMDSYNAQIYSIKAVQELILENQQQKEQIEELYKLVNELKEKL